MRVKQIKDEWSSRINLLEEIISECNKINDRSVVFLKEIKIDDDLHGPHMIRDYALIPKDILKDELNDVKKSMGSEFDNIIDFSKE